MGLFDIFRSQPKEIAAALRASDIPMGRPPTEDYKDLPVVSLEYWSPAKIRDALAGHHVGNFSSSARLTESVMGDGRVQTALNGRLKGITMRHAHLVGDAGERDKLCLEVWRRIFHDELLDQLWCWAVFEGFALCEIIWTCERIGGELLWIPGLKIWHPQYIYYNVATRRYVAITEQGAIEVDPDDPKWWLFTPWGEYRGWLRGAVRSVAPLWIIRQYAMRDFARFSEIHGMPIKVLKAPSQTGERDKDRMFGQIRNLGAAATVLLPRQTGADGTEWLLELLEAKDQSWKAFPGLVDLCDREIQQVIRGTNLTSEVQGGSYAAAQVHADEDSGYADSDCRKLCGASHRLLQLFMAYNFGEAEAAPRIRLEPPDKQDKLALAQTQQFVMTWVKQAREEGWKLDAPKVAEKYDIPLLSVTEPVAEPEPKGAPDAE